MNEIQLKYGCNPNQKPSRIFMEDGSDLPVTVLNGKPGYINFLDALNGWCGSGTSADGYAGKNLLGRRPWRAFSAGMCLRKSERCRQNVFLW